MEKPKVLVVGSGGIGGFYGGKLYQSGAEVFMLCRSDYDIIKEKGIKVYSIWGDFSYKPHGVFLAGSGAEGKYFDYVIVCTKVLPDSNITSLIKPFVGKETSIVLIQNGIDIEQPFIETFPENEIISGLAFVCCQRSRPGVIHHTDYGRLVLGVYPKGTSVKVKKLVELFKLSGVPSFESDDILKARWEKLVWNAPFNPISVLAGGANTKEMLSSSVMEEIIRAVMEEVVKIAKACGCDLPQRVIDENIEATRVMAPYKTSMLLDYESKRPMEVEAILGNVLRRAKMLGIDVPNIRMLYGLLSMVDSKNRSSDG